VLETSHAFSSPVDEPDLGADPSDNKGAMKSSGVTPSHTISLSVVSVTCAWKYQWKIPEVSNL
jgi:hypothetical protein